MASPAKAEGFTPERGISMELWKTWPAPNEWDNPAKLFPFPEWRKTVSARDLENLKNIGYDFIRVPIDPGVFIAPQTERHRKKLYADVRTTIRMVLDAGLNIVVDLHTIPGEKDRPGAVETILQDEATFQHYSDMVARFAQRLEVEDHARVALEIINEPIIDCDAKEGDSKQWPALIGKLHQAARKTAPTLPLVITGACWGDAGLLNDLPDSVKQDPNALFTFHSYAPFILTHQGAGWSGDFIVHVTGLPYPLERLGTQELERRIEAIKAKMLRDGGMIRGPEMVPYLDELIDEIGTPEKLKALMEKPFVQAAEFADANNIARNRIFLGEFGMIRQEYDTDYVMPHEWRIDFMRDTAEMASDQGFGWAVWGYSGAFGMVEEFSGRPVEGNVAAEILR